MNISGFLKSKLGKGEAFLIVSPISRRYITDFEASDGYVFVTESKTIFLTDSRYIEAAQTKSKNCDEVLLLKKADEQLPEIAEKSGISKIYTEECIAVSELKRLKKYFKCEVEADKLEEYLTELRRTKSEEEKNRIIKAQRIAETAFDNILGFIKPGVTEKEIRIQLDYFMLKNGADDPSFETIAISGSNTSMPHGVPTDKKIEKGDFVTMDYGAELDGYHSDMTRTVAVGFVTDEMAKIYDIVLSAQKNCLGVLKAGVSCKDGDAAARDIIEKAGYGDYFGHGTGHGVGLEIHENPNLSPRSKAILKAGDIVTDEPGIYIPGKFGVRIEDMVYITEGGNENLTKCEKSLIVLQ